MTSSETGWSWVRPDPVPDTVMVKLPGSVAASVARVSVATPDPPGTLAGEKPAETPAGTPVANRDTSPVNPWSGVTCTEKTAGLPAWTEAAAGVTARAKSGGSAGGRAAYAAAPSSRPWP